MNSSKKRASQEQLDMMLSCLDSNMSMATGRFNGQNGRQKNCDDWNSLAWKLNAVGFGAIKTGEKWQQAWRDWRSNVKKKATKLCQEEGRTGGGKIHLPPLNPLEERVLSILGDVAVNGVEGTQETMPPIFEDMEVIIEVTENEFTEQPTLSVEEFDIPSSKEEISPMAERKEAVVETPLRPIKRKLASDSNNKLMKRRVNKSIDEKFIDLECKKDTDAQFRVSKVGAECPSNGSANQR